MDWVRQKAEKERRSMNFVITEMLRAAKASESKQSARRTP
jgi:hypothetical protein